MPTYERSWFFRLVVPLTFLVGVWPFLALAQGRFVPQYPEDLVDKGHASEQRTARAELLAGHTKEAIVQFTRIAEAYEREGRLQEAAWTYAQIGQDERAHELSERLLAHLQYSEVVSNVAIGIGVTASRRITFADGSMAIFKNVDFQAEVAAYRVDRFLGLNIVPATVLRDIPGLGRGSVQVWIDGARTVDHFNAYAAGNYASRITSSDLFFFDHLLDNTDRHNGNYMLREGNYIVAIDQGRTFGYNGFRFNERTTRSNPIPRREVYQRLIALDDATSGALLGDVLDFAQIARFQENRRTMISEIEGLIASFGVEATFKGEEVSISGAGKTQRALDKMIRNKDWRALSLRAQHSPEFRANLLRDLTLLSADAQVQAFAALSASGKDGEQTLLADEKVRRMVVRNPQLLARFVTTLAENPTTWQEALSAGGPAWENADVQHKIFAELKGRPLHDFILARASLASSNPSAVIDLFFREPELIARAFERWPTNIVAPFVAELEKHGRWAELLDKAPEEMRADYWLAHPDLLQKISLDARIAVFTRLKLPASALVHVTRTLGQNLIEAYQLVHLVNRVDVKIAALLLCVQHGAGYEDWGAISLWLREIPENRFPEVWSAMLSVQRLDSFVRQPALFAQLIEKAGESIKSVALENLVRTYQGDAETQALMLNVVAADKSRRAILARELRENVTIKVAKDARVIFPTASEARLFRTLLEVTTELEVVIPPANSGTESMIFSGSMVIRQKDGSTLSWSHILKESRSLGLMGKLAGEAKRPMLEFAKLQRLLGVREKAGFNLRERFSPRPLETNRCEAVFGGL